MTYQEAISAATVDCRSITDKIKQVKVLLEATQEAVFNNATNGGVIKYKVNTGQSVIEVEAASLSQLRNQLREYWALYNELCGIAGGTNVMVMRDASTLRR